MSRELLVEMGRWTLAQPKAGTVPKADSVVKVPSAYSRPVGRRREHGEALVRPANGSGDHGLIAPSWSRSCS